MAVQLATSLLLCDRNSQKLRRISVCVSVSDAEDSKKHGGGTNSLSSPFTGSQCEGTPAAVSDCRESQCAGSTYSTWPSAKHDPLNRTSSWYVSHALVLAHIASSSQWNSTLQPAGAVMHITTFCQRRRRRKKRNRRRRREEETALAYGAGRRDVSSSLKLNREEEGINREEHSLVTMNELEDVSHHIQDRISTLHRMLDLSSVELPQNKMKKLGQELFVLEGLLEEFENGSQPVKNQREGADVQPAQSENVKKTNRSVIRELELITMPEFQSIPQYMKGRASYDQLNAAVQSINTATAAKYKILRQPLKTLNNHTRKLHQRFKDQETKETKGHYFVVEDDIREFTQMKVDKRFQGILNMLRHCQRLRELRGGGVVRYMLL
ncbi:hypothetical protein FQN60_014649 [Etheostoma spectabile]|uniref:SKA complex subunit 1 n=1 Tax=Etheostoma spectabile TaxID=54343 RepID=A0A5J5DCQ5_9PERO|nr:hypothetical protein FQN60_014649 [Etheostoma spectabile]